MITDEALLRRYFARPRELPCPVTEIIGVSTYRVGIGEGVFFGLADGRVIDQQGVDVGRHGFVRYKAL